jgi:hypothetical protein
MGGSAEASSGGRRLDMDQVGFERRDSTSIRVGECQAFDFEVDLDDLEEVEFSRGVWTPVENL